MSVTAQQVLDPAPSWLSRVVHRLLLWLYHRHGWRAEGAIPEPRRFIIIAAPHTSNWDFLYFVGLTADMGLRPHFMAKLSLFRWPVRNFLLQMGGVPVDRSKSGKYVDQMVAEFARRDEFVLTVAPEGTRGNVRHWRTGFYHIAMAAQVPIVCGLMDYRRKVGGLGPAIMPSGNYDADMATVAEYYHSVTPRHPHKAMDDIVKGKEPI